MRPKQEAFVREYLVDLNATQAAIRAGYSRRTAEEIGYENLKKPEIRVAIEKALAKRAQRVEVKADDILRELKHLGHVDVGQAFDDEGRMLPLKQMPEEIRRAIASVEVEQVYDGHGEHRYAYGDLVKVKFWDKPRGLELMGRHIKLFTERIEHTGKDGGPIQTEVTTKRFNLKALTDDEYRQFCALLRKMHPEEFGAPSPGPGADGGNGELPA